MPHLSILALHSSVTHFPVSMLIAALLFEVGALIFRKPEWRVVSFWLLVTAVVTAPLSLITGDLTADRFMTNGATAARVMQLHRIWAFVASGIATVLLWWRVAAKDKLGKGAVVFSLVLLAAAVAVVSVTGYLGGRMILGEESPVVVAAVPTPANASPAGGSNAVLVGLHLYQTEDCATCHKVNGRGGVFGPDLTHEALKHPQVAWQIAHLKNPSTVNPGSPMPSYGTLPPGQLKAIASYLITLK